MTEPQPPGRTPSPASQPVPTTVEDLRPNLAAVRARIPPAAERAGRAAARLRLLPVSKTVPAQRLLPAPAPGVPQMG